MRAVMAAAPPPRAAPAEVTGVRASAVLAAMFEDRGETWIVLTRRAGHLRSHRGEMSFPGGGQESGDADLRATALREAAEEVALAPDAVDIVGELHHLSTVSSRSFIVPWVAVLDGRPELTPDPSEVDYVRFVRLSELLDPAIFREERWHFPPSDRSVYFFELDGDTVWGATAAMLVDLLTRLTGTAAEPGI